MIFCLLAVWRFCSMVSMGTLTLGEISPRPQWSIISVAVVLALLSAVLPAYLVAQRKLYNRPAQLLLPKPPVAGSRIFLERLGFIWRRLSFTHKVTARNIFRYKLRMLMTIFGVMGSVTLLFAGLGIRSSVAGVVPSQFEESLRYQFQVVEKKRISPSEKKDLDSWLKDDRIDKQEAIYTETSDQLVPGLAEQQSVTLMASESEQFSDLVRLYNRDANPIELSDGGVIVSQKLASLYGLEVGDALPYRDQDGKDHEFHISEISRLYAGHFILMNKTYYEDVLARRFTVNSHLISLKGEQDQSEVAAGLLKQDGVASVVRNTMLIMTLDAIVVSLNGVMRIWVALSIMLAVVVLYNLTTINVAERIRELSTIKVLGFFNREVTLYIYRETIILSLLGIGFGLGSGFTLHRYIINRLGSHSITFEQEVGLEVYLVPVIAVILILADLGCLVNHRLKKLDMLEALKSVD